MDMINAIILGFVEGITEFLPISSSGHLILVRSALSMSDQHALAYDAVLQLAAGMAIVLYFHKDLWRMFQTFLRMVARMPVDQKEKVLLQAIIVGTVPALILGLLLEKKMETIFRNPLLVALSLVAGSLLFAYAEYASSFFISRKEITLKNGIIIGFFQACAVIPGLSRSGATISGGLILGLTRYEAARFSFLLSVPIIIGSGLKKFLELLLTEGLGNMVPLGVGALVSFVVGLLAIHFMLKFLKNHTLWPFVWYRIALAMVVLIFVFTQ